MAEVGSYEAKTHLPALLRRVEAGERIVITRHGRPVAELVPPASQGRPELDRTIQSLRTFGNGRRLGPDLSLRELIDEGRRR
ncbi:MAG: type II toxin-antitoxin system Phd/YefM family antitoxin [Gemmatimonadales bacterium]|nr:MAG: type II toxin-antitoxin system Phd/YefM family antitoxin [Gemmatimonadales bacterium]